MEEALDGHEHDGDGDDRRAENHDDAGGVVGPDEQRQAAPGKAGSAHAVDGDDEVQSGENGGESGNEDRESGLDNLGVGVLGAEWAVESPARVDAAGQHDVRNQDAADDVEIPAQQVDAREGKILRPDHERHQKISQHRRHHWDQKEEHHDHAVHGEHLVIGVGLHQVALRRQQLEPDEHGKEAAEKEERRHRNQIEDRDPLVVGGQQPGLEPVPVVEIVQLWS